MSAKAGTSNIWAVNKEKIMERKSVKRKWVAKRVVFVALFAALTAACGFISIPMPVTVVPIVLQNMMAVVNGLVMGPVWGTLATVLFILVGMVGLPVFSGGTAGIARLVGPTGGFIIGYAIASAVGGLILGRPRIEKKEKVWKIGVATVASFFIMYVPGVAHFMRVMGASFGEAMAMCVTPFVVGDVIKAVVCVIIAGPIRKWVASFVFSDDVVEEG